ncbi:transcriptional regulator [Candidatus Bathyarchaeota archaeon]|nr:transcriptional regulator [Candidatus Bathyarchaeota archaeon]
MQIKYPCEIVSKHLLPALRSLIAKGLIEEYSLTQTVAAEKLGTTQAAISYYLSSKRGEKHINQLNNDLLLKKTIHEITQGLATGGMSSQVVMKKICDLYLCEKANTIPFPEPPPRISIFQASIIIIRALT